MANGYFVAAQYWDRLSDRFASMFERGEQRRARLDAANAIGRDAQGYIKPVQLYEPGSYYGDAFNEAAASSFVAAARSAAREQFQLAAQRNKLDPDAFDAFAQTFVERQINGTPDQLKQPLRLDFAELAGQYKVGILANVNKMTEERRKASILSDADEVAQEHYQLAVAGDAEGMVKRSVELEASASALENMGAFSEAARVRQMAQRNVKIGPIIGRVNRGMEAREAVAPGQGGPLDAYISLVSGAESGGRANAKNPNSSATGLYQFINETWLDQVKRNHPDLAEGRTEEEVLALRKNPDAQSRVMATFTKENYDALRGAKITNIGKGELYLAHFLGAGDAIKVLKEDPNALASNVVDARSVAANKSVLAGKTVGEVRRWADRKMKEDTVQATLEGKYGTAQDYANAVAADMLGNPGKYDLDETTSRQVAGLVQNMGAARAAARVSEDSTQKADLAFDFGMAQLDYKQKIIADVEAGRDPADLSQEIIGTTIAMARKYHVPGVQTVMADQLANEFQATMRMAAQNRDTMAETIQEIARLHQGGARIEPSDRNVKAVDYLTKRMNGGRDLSLFVGEDRSKIEAAYKQFGMLPSLVRGQLQNASKWTTPEQAGALSAVVSFVRDLGQQRGMEAVTNDIARIVGEKEAGLLTELAGRDVGDPLALARANEQIQLMKAQGIDTLRRQRISLLGETPAKQAAELDTRVRKALEPGAITSAIRNVGEFNWNLVKDWNLPAPHRVLLGDSPEAFFQWLAPRHSQQFYDLARKNAHALIGDYEPDKAIERGVAKATEESAFSTYIRRPGEELSGPRLVPKAPERYWGGVEFREALAAAATARMNELKVQQPNMAGEIGQLLGIAAAIGDAGIGRPEGLEWKRDPTKLKEILNSGLPSVDRDATIDDARKLIAVEKIDVWPQGMKDGKPTYYVTLNHDGMYLPILDNFQPPPDAASKRQAGEAMVGWMRRVEEHTGIQIPAVVPGLGAGLYDRAAEEAKKVLGIGTGIGDAYDRFREGFNTGAK